jgi:hypothetical protein
MGQTAEVPARYLAAFVTILAGLPALYFWQSSAALAHNTSHASADDCAVLAQASKALQQTGDKKDAPMSPTSYGVDCDWKAFGIAAPVVAPVVSGPYYPGVRFSFTRPIYAANGLEATTDYTMGGNGGPTDYFYVGYRCTAQKHDGRWQPAACKMQYIT